MKSFLFLSIMLLLVLNTIAQIDISTKHIDTEQLPNINWCGSLITDAAWDEAFNKAVAEYKAHLKTSETASLNSYVIPVIVHIIHGGQAIGTWPNISQAQINSQINVLNQDYSGNGAGVSQYNTVTLSGHGPFYDYAQANSLPAPNNTNSGVIVSNTGLQFCMALTDPLGNTLAEPGIDRVNYITKGFSNPTSISSASFNNYLDNTLKPAVIWDITKYMNVYVSDRPSASGLLGFTTFPALSTLAGLSSGIGTTTNDGIWIYGKAFGTTGTLISGYTGGQVCGHESGHYFGLRHPWGDGTCLTDYCNDTPPAFQANYNSNSVIIYPYVNSSGSCTGNYGDGEMYMNLMDYSLDVSKFMFTTDQAIRMQTAMQNSPYRNLLGTHNLCTGSTTGIINQSTQNLATIYPNPNNGLFQIELTQSVQMNVINTLGEIIMTEQLGAGEHTLNLINQTSGIYFIKLIKHNDQQVVKLIKY